MQRRVGEEDLDDILENVLAALCREVFEVRQYGGIYWIHTAQGNAHSGASAFHRNTAPRRLRRGSHRGPMREASRSERSTLRRTHAESGRTSMLVRSNDATSLYSVEIGWKLGVSHVL